METESAHPADLHVLQDLLIRLMYLLAIGLPHEIAHGSLRMTLSEETTKEDIDFTVDKLKEIVQYLRNMSPLYEDFIKVTVYLNLSTVSYSA